MGNLIDPTQYEREQATKATELEKELQQAREADENKIPEKYRGKTLEEVIQMHQEAEKEKSRLGNEVGQLRSQILQRREHKTEEEPKKVEVDVDSLLENPQETIQSVVKQEVKDLQHTIQEIENDRLRRQFEQRHANYKDDLQDDSFYEWIKGNPIRITLAQSADTGDYQAANLLWDMWEEVKQIKQSAAQIKKDQDKMDREKKLQDGMLESGTGSVTESKKVFRRSEITNLKTRAKLGDREAQRIVDDPAWQREVLTAYAQKRVI